MSEEKMYAVKNDEGKYWDFEDQDGFWELNTMNLATIAGEEVAECVARDRGGHVVTFVEEPKPLVVPEWFDKWLGAFCRQGDGYSWRDLAAGRILQQGWGKSINDSYEATESHWAIPYVENKQVDYVLHHKKELMVAALTGNYTVAKEKKYNVKVPHANYKWYLKTPDGKLDTIWVKGLSKGFGGYPDGIELTNDDIEKFGLQDCEKEEVTDDAD